MFDTAAIAAKSSGWSLIRPRMSRSARTRSLAVPAARRLGMAPWYAAQRAAPAWSAPGPICGGAQPSAVAGRDGPGNKGDLLSGLLLRRYGVELHPVEQGVVGDRAGVGGPPAQGLHVFLATAAEIGGRNGGKGHQLHGVDLDIPRPDGIAAAGPDLRAPPQPEGDGDVARDHVVTQLPAEVHQPM